MQLVGAATGLMKAGLEGAQRMNGLQRSVAATGAASDAAATSLLAAHGGGGALGPSGVPVVFDGNVLSGLWSGNFGRAPYSTLVRPRDVEIEVSRALRDGDDVVIGAAAEVSGKVLDASGARVGQFTRGVSWNAGQRPQVEHQFLRLDDSAQGTGFSRDFNRHAYERYERLGVEQVNIHAALDVGGYAWAQDGFELKAKGAASATQAMWMRAEGVRDLVSNAYRRGSITLDEAWELADRVATYDRRMPHDAIKSVQALADHELGKQVLLGADWYGARTPVIAPAT